jgi:hypothetical protein
MSPGVHGALASKESVGSLSPGMDEAAIAQYITATFADVDVLVGSAAAGSPEIAWGDTFFTYDPDRNPETPAKFPFATIVIKDYGDFDNASNLDRPGVFRLNIGVTTATYRRLFGDERSHDFTALDRLIPHPVYGRQHWVSVLNPTDASFEAIKPLLAEAYELAVQRRPKARGKKLGDG